MVERLHRRLGEPGACALLGVQRRDLRAWRRQDGRMSFPSRKLIWLTWCLVFRPELLRTFFSVATWGRFEQERRDAPAVDYQI